MNIRVNSFVDVIAIRVIQYKWVMPKTKNKQNKERCNRKKKKKMNIINVLHNNPMTFSKGYWAAIVSKVCYGLFLIIIKNNKTLHRLDKIFKECHPTNKL